MVAACRRLAESGWEVDELLVPDPSESRSPVCDDVTKEMLLVAMGAADLIVSVGSGVSIGRGVSVATTTAVGATALVGVKVGLGVLVGVGVGWERATVPHPITTRVRKRYPTKIFRNIKFTSCGATVAHSGIDRYS